MKKTVYLSILGIITLCCIIFGTVRANKKFSGVKDLFSNGFESVFAYDEESQEISGNDVFYPSEFDEIKINATVLAVKIQEGKTASVQFDFSNKRLKPEISVKNNKLYISQKGGRNGGINQRAQVFITLPKQTKLSKIDIDVNVGEVSIKDIFSEINSIETDVGAISLQNVDFISLEAQSDIGEISVKTKEPLSAYSIKAQTDVGEISIGGSDKGRNFNQLGSGRKKIEAKSDVGAISISAE